MNGKHLFIQAMSLLALIAMSSLTVKGTLEQMRAASDTEIRDFDDIPRSQLYKRVCGVHSWKNCERRRSSAIKVKKNTLLISVVV